MKMSRACSLIGGLPMHFKRLEIIGFKSFRDRTVLEFEPGVTAIVGPNGCGKSNISDAIRWVLGEQSAKNLRGSSMEDVIFNGTQWDEPLGLAEVSLTLSNEKKFLPIEYDEVTITRRIFRSGESEYLINHVPVRLRDVVELVMGTGLGQISYAHMAQGKIDEILSARPEERRLLFEEASGITKYRSQKREALRKLEQTEANLLRLNDILTELGRQIRSLERQAEKAQRYKEDFEKLKGLELGVACHEFRALTEKMQTFSEKKLFLKEEEERLSRERDLLLEKIGSLRGELEKLESHLTTLQGKKMALASRIGQDQDRILLHKERIGELTQTQERLSREKEQLEKDTHQFKQHVEESEREFEKSLGEIETKKTTLVSLEETLREVLKLIATSEEEISKGKLKTIETAQEHTKVKNDLNRLSAEHHTLSSRERRLILEKEETMKEGVQVRERREAVEKTVRETGEKVASLREEKKALQEETYTLSRSLRTLVTEIQALRQKLSALSSRCELLEEAKKNYEGFSQGTKAVLREMEQKNPEFQKCHGVLADLLGVIPGYERVVEELLGPIVQALVVEDEETARRAVRYLEAKGFGRASFVALSSFREKGMGEGNALSRVKTSPAYQTLLSSLLECAFIVEEMEQISFQKTFDKTYATRKGELCRRGILTGGSPLSEDVGLIGREAKIVALRNEIAQTEEGLERSSEKERNLEVTQKEKEVLLSQKTDECHRGEVELSNQKNLLEAVLGEEKKLQEEISLVDLEFEEVKGELQELRVKENALTEQLHALEEEDRKLQETLVHTHSLIDQKQMEREKTVVQIAEIKTELASALERCEDQKKAHALLQATFQEKLASISSREEQEQASAQRIAQLTEEILNLEEEHHRLLEELEEVEKASTTTETDQKARLSEELSFHNQISLYETQLSENQKSSHDLEMKEKDLEYQMKAIEERLRLAYKVELTSAEAEEGREATDVETVRPEIERLREKLERMGPVNLVAIEEYEELKKRNEFLTHQKGDLEKAKVSLHEAIRKINRVTKELFLTTFHQIQTNFQEYFRLLFGGGDARLLLLDEQDVLESGIEILACPPGKKLQSVSLLSGGERALTVIALLFAIFREKPSPFCVLDEIDAPLDESNVVRFTSVLQEFLKSSQFIIVTHNKRTITMADVMYGITMEKTGVSKIVSAKFKEESDSEKKVAIPA